MATLLEDFGRMACDCEPSPLVDLSMRWVLQRSFVSGSVVGARTQQQLTAVMAAAERGSREPLSQEVLEAVDRVHARFPNPCP